MDEYKDPDYMKKWRKANQEKIRAYRRQHYLKHREEEIAAAIIWNAENPESHWYAAKAAAANLRYPGPRLDSSDIKSVVDNSDRTCYWCGKKELSRDDITLEHLRPSNHTQNLVIACFSCNSSRCALTGGPISEEERERRKKNYNREYYLKNRERIAKAQANWAARNREHLREYRREYYLKTKTS